MATLVHTATTSGTDIAPSTLSAMPSNGNTPEQTVNSSTRSTRKIKHCHVFATHSQQRTSCLTQGAETPSFLGFRNLMILVLSAHSSLATQHTLSNKKQSSRISGL